MTVERMKRIIKHFMMLLCTSCLGMTAYAVGDNKLSLGLSAELCNQEVTVPLLLNNQTGVSSLQFDLLLPKGLSLQGNASSAFQLTGRDVAHRLVVTPLSNGKIRVLLFSMRNAPFTGNEGPILHLSMTTGDECGIQPLVFSNIILSDTSEREYECPDTSLGFIICKTDDVNDDGVLNEQDVTAVFNVVSTTVPESGGTDLNGDGQTTIQDIVAMIELLKKVSRQ